jgi:hypothetical protein
MIAVMCAVVLDLLTDSALLGALMEAASSLFNDEAAPDEDANDDTSDVKDSSIDGASVETVERSTS